MKSNDTYIAEFEKKFIIFDSSFVRGRRFKKRIKSREQVRGLIITIEDFFKAALEQKDAEWNKQLSELERDIFERGHGGGNWRRVVIQAVNRLKRF